MKQPAERHCPPGCPPAPLRKRRRKSGHGDYPYLPQDWQVGAGLVLLRQGQSAAEAETWVRNELGERDDEAPAAAAQGGAGAAQGACAAPHGLL